MKALVSGPKRRHVCNIDSWLQAWSAYTATVLLVDPVSGYELIGYQSIVAQPSSEYQTSAWLKCDRTFRYFASRTTSINMGHDRPSPVSSVLHRSCSNIDHLLYMHPTRSRWQQTAHTDQSFRPPPPKQATTSSGTIFNPPSGKPKICRLFNAGKCKNQASPSLCKYRHKCFICYDDHREATCSCKGTNKQA